MSLLVTKADAAEWKVQLQVRFSHNRTANTHRKSFVFTEQICNSGVHHLKSLEIIVFENKV